MIQVKLAGVSMIMTEVQQVLQRDCGDTRDTRRTRTGLPDNFVTAEQMNNHPKSEKTFRGTPCICVTYSLHYSKFPNCNFK